MSANSDNYMEAVQATSLLYKNDCDIFIHMNGDIASNIPAYGRIQGFLDICEVMTPILIRRETTN